MLLDHGRIAALGEKGKGDNSVASSLRTSLQSFDDAQGEAMQSKTITKIGGSPKHQVEAFSQVSG
jgi:hypothetical protein